MENKDKILVTVEDVKSQDSLQEIIRARVEDIISNYSKLKSGDVVFIKPNLVMPRYIPGVCTSPVLLEALCAALSDRNCKICICEGDGGLASFSAMKAFVGNGLFELLQPYGVDFISLSLLPRENVVQNVAERRVAFILPKVLVERDFDYFINVAVMKVHIMTIVSLSMKNLWGCIPDPYRIHYHHILDMGIVALWKTIRPDLSIIDGIVAADGNAPLNGIQVPLGVLLAGDSDASLDRVAVKLMGIPFEKVEHLALAEKEGLVRKWDQINLTQPFDKFLIHRFWPKRRLSNWPGIFLGQFPTLQGFVYHSFASKFFYWLLRKMARKDIGKELPKYGEASWGDGCGPSDFCKIPGSTRLGKQAFSKWKTE